MLYSVQMRFDHFIRDGPGASMNDQCRMILHAE